MSAQSNTTNESGRKRRRQQINTTSKRRRVHHPQEWCEAKRSSLGLDQRPSYPVTQPNPTEDIRSVTDEEEHSEHIPASPAVNPTHSTDSALSVAECTSPINHSLSSYFAAMERYFEGQRMMKLQLPSKLVHRLTALFAAPTERDDVRSLLRSVRYGHYNNAQVAFIGTAEDEMLNALTTVLADWPMDVISNITEFVGHTLVWLRDQGLNVLKWSAASGERQKHSLRGSSGRRMAKLLPMLAALVGVDGFGGDEFYFNGYGSEEMVDWVDTLCPLSFEQFDLDWCLAVFLVLGVVPSPAADEDGHWDRSLCLKLNSALPGNCAMGMFRTPR